MPCMRPASVAWIVATSGRPKATFITQAASVTIQSWACNMENGVLLWIWIACCSSPKLRRLTQVRKSGVGSVTVFTRCTLTPSASSCSTVPGWSAVTTWTSQPDFTICLESSATTRDRPPITRGGYSQESMRVLFVIAPLTRCLFAPLSRRYAHRQLLTGQRAGHEGHYRAFRRIFPLERRLHLLGDRQVDAQPVGEPADRLGGRYALGSGPYRAARLFARQPAGHRLA